MIRHGAQMAFAYARATVPRIAVVLRKSYGGAYIVMDSKTMGNDVFLAWPSAELAVMGASQAAEILHRRATDEERAERVRAIFKHLAEDAGLAIDPETEPPRNRLTASYRELEGFEPDLVEAEGRLVDGCVTCPWHGYQYRPEDGQSPPPYTEKLHTHRVRVRDGRVEVDPEPQPPGTHLEPARIEA